MESHHIVPEEANGPDTFENCIPLCFDCHADQKGYDHKHPKGTKYSEAELQLHRDRWYAKVAEGGKDSSNAAVAQADNQTFRTFQELVPYHPTLDYLKDRNFAGPFERAPLEPLFRYARDGARVEYEFLNSELEAARLAFVKAALHLASLLSLNTWSTASPGVYEVPPEWRSTQSERYESVVQQIHDAVDTLAAAHATLVRSAKSRLQVTAFDD